MSDVAANPLASVVAGASPANPLAADPTHIASTPRVVGSQLAPSPPIQPLKISRWGRNNEYRRMEIEFRKSAERPDRPFGIDPDGQAHYTGPFHPEREYLDRAIGDYLSPFGDGKYVRSTLKKDDYDHLKNGTHRGSVNHSTGESEGGLSVARTSEFPSKYTYLVSGQEIGKGTDHEPLLDVRTARPASRLMSSDAFTKIQTAAIEARLKTLGLSHEAYKTLVSGHKRLVASGNAVHDEIV